VTNVPLVRTDWRRLVADEAQIILKNRFFEANPVNLETQAALISRPGLKKWLDVGEGPITQVYSQPGSFSDCLFVGSNTSLYRVDTDETVTLIQAGAYTNGAASSPEFVATGEIGSTPEYLFTTDGGVLWLYVEDGYARGTITATGTISVADVVRIDGVYYSIQTSSLDTGSPAGTSGNPWKVQKGADNAATMQNLFDAVNATGTPGTSYSTALTEHLTVAAYTVTSTTVSVRAKDAGATGNSIVTTETSAGLSWGSGTLTDGGNPSMTQVVTPDDIGMVSLGYIAGYVICIPAQDQGFNGRFYWIEPGATTIDPLNFATAEKSPDAILQIRVVGDQFWLFGTNSTEVWYPTGDALAPFTRVQGRLFERGILEGTAIVVKDSVMLIDNTGTVYRLEGSPKEVSNPSISELLLNAANNFPVDVYFFSRRRVFVVANFRVKSPEKSVVVISSYDIALGALI